MGACGGKVPDTLRFPTKKRVILCAWRCKWQSSLYHNTINKTYGSNSMISYDFSSHFQNYWTSLFYHVNQKSSVFVQRTGRSVRNHMQINTRTNQVWCADGTWFRSFKVVTKKFEKITRFTRRLPVHRHGCTVGDIVDSTSIQISIISLHAIKRISRANSCAYMRVSRAKKAKFGPRAPCTAYWNRA